MQVTKPNRSAGVRIVQTMTTGDGRGRDWFVVLASGIALVACAVTLLWGSVHLVGNWRGWMADGVSPVWPGLYAVAAAGLVWFTAFAAVEACRAGSARAARRVQTLCCAIAVMTLLFWPFEWAAGLLPLTVLWLFAAAYLQAHHPRSGRR